MMDNNIEATVYSIKDTLGMSLSIPNYQRPYIWDPSNVDQLINDVKTSMENRKLCYRIGSIILYTKKGINEIVDGQQRITTLWLLIHALGGDVSGCNIKFSNELSKRHIIENYKHIRNTLNEVAWKDNFYKYLMENCQFVVVSIKTDLSLAFRVFDSQNGRGKPLEAYNLLKAYHLRAMSCENDETKITSDRMWEHYARYDVDNGIYDILKHLFDEQLYRTRVWSKGQVAWEFSKKEISEFKGMQFDKKHPILFPFQNKQMLLFIAERFYQQFLLNLTPTSSRMKDGEDGLINPFVTINQPIVDGKSFFEYIRSYSEMYRLLFLELDSYQLKEFKAFYKENCLEYAGHWRVGDNYIREMYKSLIMLLFDRFGEQGINDYHRQLWLLAYRPREKSRVYYSTVAENASKYFTAIENAKDFASLSILNNHVQEMKQTLNDFHFAKLDRYANVFSKYFNIK